jgi:hypothetical protein
MITFAAEHRTHRGDLAARENGTAMSNRATLLTRVAVSSVMRAMGLSLAVLGLVVAGAAPAQAGPSYDSVVLADGPVLYLAMRNAGGTEPDLSGHGLTGTYEAGASGAFTTATLPNGDTATVFDGNDQYLEVPDDDALSVPTTGALTVEAWMRPDTLQFDHTQSSGYVHWMGKGVSGQHEYVARMYNLVNDVGRPNRISGYSFNLAGGLGAGSYFEDDLSAKPWIDYALVITTAPGGGCTTGYTKVYRDGKLRDTDCLSSYNITPGNGTAPLRVGTRDFASFFRGPIAKVAVFPAELTPAQLNDHHEAMHVQAG